MRGLFTHGVKGNIKWGVVHNQPVICKNTRMIILEQRGKKKKRYYVPGTKIRILKKKYLTAKINPKRKRIENMEKDFW